MAPPNSALGDVFRNVRKLLGDAGDATPIMVGKKYLTGFGAGSPPRVLFVPEPKGKAGPVLEIGARQVASFVHSCRVYVRAAEDGTEDGRFDAAYALSDKVMNALQASGSGRLVLSEDAAEDASPTNDDAYGADVTFGFRFTRPVLVDDDIWNAAYAAAPSPALSPSNPDQPNGDTGLTFATGAITFEHQR